jgi:hypothetical protein
MCSVGSAALRTTGTGFTPALIRGCVRHLRPNNPCPGFRPTPPARWAVYSSAHLPLALRPAQLPSLRTERHCRVARRGPWRPLAPPWYVGRSGRVPSEPRCLELDGDGVGGDQTVTPNSGFRSEPNSTVSARGPGAVDSPAAFTLQTVPTTNSCRSGRAVSMTKSHLKLVAPTEVNRTVAPTRRPNAKLRTRERLTSFRAGAGQAILEDNGIPGGGLEQHEILSTPG